MSLVDVSLLATAIAFGVYGVLSALACGVSIGWLWPKLAAGTFKKSVKLIISWEATNLFLAAGILSYVVLFNNGLGDVSRAVRPLLIVGVVGLAMRAILGLYLYRLQISDTPRWLKLLFAKLNFIIPLSFAGVGVYFLTGEQFWQSLAGWLLMAATILGLLCIGLAWTTKHTSLTQIVFGSWLIALGLLLPFSLTASGSALVTYSLTLWLSLIGITAAGVVATDGVLKKSYLKYAAAGIGLLSPVFLVFANRPYLISGKLVASDAYSARASEWLPVGSLLAAIVLLLIGFWIFSQLLPRAVAPKPNSA